MEQEGSVDQRSINLDFVVLNTKYSDLVNYSTFLKCCALNSVSIIFCGMKDVVKYHYLSR